MLLGVFLVLSLLLQPYNTDQCGLELESVTRTNLQHCLRVRVTNAYKQERKLTYRQRL